MTTIIQAGVDLSKKELEKLQDESPIDAAARISSLAEQLE